MNNKVNNSIQKGKSYFKLILVSSSVPNKPHFPMFYFLSMPKQFFLVQSAIQNVPVVAHQLFSRFEQHQVQVQQSLSVKNRVTTGLTRAHKLLIRSLSIKTAFGYI